MYTRGKKEEWWALSREGWLERMGGGRKEANKKKLNSGKCIEVQTRGEQE